MTDRYSRRFSVLGIDEDGDVQAFRTDDLQAAESMRKEMEEDPTHVELIDHKGGLCPRPFSLRQSSGAALPR